MGSEDSRRFDPNSDKADTAGRSATNSHRPFDGARLGQVCRSLTEAATGMVEVDRAGIWAMNEAGDTLTCIDLYERQKQRHRSGAVLTIVGHPNYFAGLATAEAIVTDSRERSPHLIEFSETYLETHGIKALLDIPVYIGERLAGVVRLERIDAEHAWSAEQRSLAIAVAELFAFACDVAAAPGGIDFETHCRIAFDKPPFAIFHFDETLTLTCSNARFVEILQPPSGQADGFCLRDLPDKTLLPTLHAGLQGKVVHFEGEYRPPGSPTRIWVSLHAAPIEDERGRRLGGIGILEDVTARKRREVHRDQMARVVEQSPMSILITDRNGLIEFANPAFAAMTGYAPEDIVGQRPSLLKSGETPPSVYKDMWDTILSGQSWSGVLRNRKQGGKHYWQQTLIAPLTDSAGSITHFAAFKQDITEKTETEARLHHLAYFDPLTDLPNRSLLRDRLDQAIATAERERAQAAVLFLDLDNFKNVNDSLGHSAGDALLIGVGQRLRCAMRNMDTVGRLGGDEFAIVLPDTGPDGAARVAQKLLRALAKSHVLEDRVLSLTPSIGIGVYPGDGRDGETLLKNAEAAMYQAKQAGRNGYQFFRAEMNAVAFERLILENNLRLALEQEKLELHYQPQIDLTSGKLVGMEALLRWTHPELGAIPPSRFIPVAEDGGMIAKLGEWVLREACRQNRAWQTAGIASIPVAVNLSALQFRQQKLQDVVRQALADTGLAADHLELELTERIVMNDAESTIATLKDIDAMGVKLSIDDFGTGYSSLSYLKRFPLDTLKIDQSFVRGIDRDADNLAIAKAVIGVGHSLRLSITAEGVETPEQMQLLRDNGCDCAQGYFVAEPMPAREMGAFLATHAATAWH